MSSHAATIREFLDELRRINAETGASAAKQFMWKNRELVVELLAEIKRLEHERNFLQRELGFKNTQRQEIQRLRDALERIANQEPNVDYVDTVMRRTAREALAGDAE